MISKLFFAHGYFCASHPWEVLISTLTITISLISMSIWAPNNNACGWSYQCDTEKELSGSSPDIITVTRWLAVIYVYMQFRKMRKFGSNYLLAGDLQTNIVLFKGLAGLFTLSSSIIFSIVFANLMGCSSDGLNEALPFFLLLTDLSKASALARMTLKSVCQDKLQENIGRGIAIIGPALTLDSVVATLVIGMGTISGLRPLDKMCSFGCLFVISNYLAFMIFYPACLSLVLELTQDCSEGQPFLQLSQIAKVLQKEDEVKSPNPVSQQIKVIMAAGLVLVHAHRRLVTDDVLPISHITEIAIEESTHQHISPDAPMWQYYIAWFLKSNYGATLVLAICLMIKYFVFDDNGDQDQQHEIKSEEQSCNLHNANSAYCLEESHHISNGCANDRPLCQDQNSTKEVKQIKFIIGSSSEENLVKPADVLMDAVTQTEMTEDSSDFASQDSSPRNLEQCVEILKSDVGPKGLSDEEIQMLVSSRHIPSYNLENVLGDHKRGVDIRRKILSGKLQLSNALDTLPFTHYDYKPVAGACCENVIGYMPVPVGVAGPLLLDGNIYQIPMATTEGCLVASTNRGCRALEQSGGVTSIVTNDGMTRGPVVRFYSAARASEAKLWMETPDNFNCIKKDFDSTSRFARLKKLHIGQAGRNLYIRFVSVTGDAMGMNMLSKGVERALKTITETFLDMEIISLSGNFCTDKKPAAINWIEGRGKSVVCEAIVKSSIVKKVLKTTVSALVELNISKNLVGSAMAGSIGGFNAHAANIVTAIYIATGQDPAQNVTSSNCILLMESTGTDNEDLHISCTMPSIEVGTVGGGTVLQPQSACLKMLGVAGSHIEHPGENACQLARIICATVMAGELSLMSALAAGHLVKSHLKHNRSTTNISQEKGNAVDANICLNKAS